MYTQIFVLYSCVPLICSPFLYRITSYAVVEFMGEKEKKKTRGFYYNGAAMSHPITTVPALVQCAAHVPVQPILVESSIFSLQ